MDLFSTVLEVARVPAPADRTIDDRNILSRFASDAKSPHEVILGQRAENFAIVRGARWKLHLLAPGIRVASRYRPADDWIDPRAPIELTILAPYEQATPGDYPRLLTGARPARKLIRCFTAQARRSLDNGVVD
jgi:hypothetical protein